jgi:hypothetical protein
MHNSSPTQNECGTPRALFAQDNAPLAEDWEAGADDGTTTKYLEVVFPSLGHANSPDSTCGELGRT